MDSFLRSGVPCEGTGALLDPLVPRPGAVAPNDATFHSAAGRFVQRASPAQPAAAVALRLNPFGSPLSAPEEALRSAPLFSPHGKADAAGVHLFHMQSLAWIEFKAVEPVRKRVGIALEEHLQFEA